MQRVDGKHNTPYRAVPLTLILLVLSVFTTLLARKNQLSLVLAPIVHVGIQEERSLSQLPDPQYLGYATQATFSRAATRSLRERRVLPSHRYKWEHLASIKDSAFYKGITGSDSRIPEAAAAPQEPCVHKDPGYWSKVRGQWYRDTAGLWSWEPKDCALRRFSAQKARDCLGGKRIVTIGDSVSRYTYLSLVHLLAAGHYHHPYDDINAGPSVTNKDQWSGWKKFYKGAQKRISHLARDHGGMVCEGCKHGNESLPWEAWRYWGVAPNLSSPSLRDSEYRQALQDPKLGHTPKGQLSLDFNYAYKFPTFASAGIEAVSWAFNVPTPDVSKGKQRYRLAKVDDTDWSSVLVRESDRETSSKQSAQAQTLRKSSEEERAADQNDVTGNTFPPMSKSAKEAVKRALCQKPNWRPPDVLILNMGIFWWPPVPGSADLTSQLTALFSYAQRLAKEHGTQLVWRTTTIWEWDHKTEPPNSTAPPARTWNSLASSLAEQHGFKVLDFRGIASSAEDQKLEMKWSSKSVHFLPVVYEQVNDLLLNMMCPAA